MMRDKYIEEQYICFLSCPMQTCCLTVVMFLSDKLWVDELKLPSVDCSLHLTVGARHANAAAGSQACMCIDLLVATTYQCNVSMEWLPAGCLLHCIYIYIYIHTHIHACRRWECEWEWVMGPANGFFHPKCMQAADAHAQDVFVLAL
jgi:hypothetical protein